MCVLPVSCAKAKLGIKAKPANKAKAAIIVFKSILLKDIKLRTNIILGHIIAE